jgi:rSAM/selenodomain-associated transferase 1
MLAKHWQPGRVKTRLARTLGESHAAMVHAFFVLALVERLKASGERRMVAFDPPQSERAFHTVVKGQWELAPQPEGDLGQRMERLLADGLLAAQRVVLIGADSPDLPVGMIDEAFAALATYDVVLGPSADGGYYLIGVARRVPPVFQGIDWSTPEVWSQTTTRLHAAGIAWHRLPPWYDVDDGEGLQDLAARLTAVAASDARLAQLQRELRTLLGPDSRRPSKIAH